MVLFPSAGPDQQVMEVEEVAQPEVVEETESNGIPAESSNARSLSPHPPASAEEREELAELPSVDPGEGTLASRDIPMEVDTELQEQPIEIISVASSPAPAPEHTGDTTEEEPEPDQDLDAEGEPDEIQVEEVLGQATEDEAYILDDNPYPYPPTTEEDPANANDQGESPVDAPVVELGAPSFDMPDVPVEDDASDDADQQSELTALSDSDSASPARRMRSMTLPRVPRSPSSGELTELPTPDERSDVAPETQRSVDEELPEPGPSKKTGGRKSTGGSKKKAKGKKTLTNPDLGKVILKRGQPLLEPGTLGEL